MCEFSRLSWMRVWTTEDLNTFGALERVAQGFMGIYEL